MASGSIKKTVQISSTTITGTTNGLSNLLVSNDSNKIILAAYCTSEANICCTPNRAGNGALWLSINERGSMAQRINTEVTIVMYWIQL